MINLSETIGLKSDDIIIGCSAAGIMIMFMLYGQSQKQAQIRKRIARMKQRKFSGPKTSAFDALSLRRKEGQKMSPLLELLLKPLPNMDAFGDKLTRAGYTINPKQFMLRALLCTLLIAFIIHLMHKPFLAGLCGGFIVSFWIPIKVVNFKINSEQKRFLRLFPDAIDLIVRGLRSGLPVSESITLVAQEVPEPVSSAFRTVSDTMKLGVPMEKAMQEVAKKLDYTEFNFFVTSIILQRETGGNLSEILNNLGEVLRKRLMMAMKIKAMTSEARASSMIIGSLPFIVTIAVSVMSPDYIKPLFNDYRGNYAAATAASLLFLGIWSMNRMAKFEI